MRNRIISLLFGGKGVIFGHHWWLKLISGEGVKFEITVSWKSESFNFGENFRSKVGNVFQLFFIPTLRKFWFSEIPTFAEFLVVIDSVKAYLSSMKNVAGIQIQGRIDTCYMSGDAMWGCNIEMITHCKTCLFAPLHLNTSFGASYQCPCKNWEKVNTVLYSTSS